MKIGTIVGSNSHIDYVARVADGDEASPADHGFGQFTAMATGTETFVGIVYDSRLINPEFSSFGPRLQPKPAIEATGSSDRPGVLIGIIVLGTVSRDGIPDHSIPRQVIPVGQAVETMSDQDVSAFHTGANGAANIGYYQRIMSHSGQFAVPLLESIIDRLCLDCSDTERERLKVLKSSLIWQSTFAGTKL
jgi:hypothetical protein